MKKSEDLERAEMLSLNSEISEFDVQVLESRLETDPLVVGGLVELTTTQDLSQSLTAMSDCEGDCHSLIIAININRP